jgi:MoaA/NifB/PqqE/SkfB family radical SAM enzyme
MIGSPTSYVFTQHTVEECVNQLKSEFDVIDVVTCSTQITNIDFYLKIKNLYRPCFEPNQRLIFVITRDYTTSESRAQLLQNLQSIICDIDISNFFVCLVTTNPDIKKDYQQIFDNFSQDPVPFHVYQCQGEYEKIQSNDLGSFSKYASVKNLTDQISKIRDDQKQLLFESKTFCMLPWAGINVEPNNVVRPCCEFNQPLGDSSQDSLETIWNSNAWKQVRKDMLSNVPVPACQRCYEKESLGRDTLRQSSNRLLVEKIDLVDRTKDDGYLDVFHLNYWDVRYNNLCNLACRSCGPEASSSWYQPAVKIGWIHNDRAPMLIAGRSEHDIFYQIIQHVDHVKQIYFAGGEPAMIDKFYEILEILDAHGRHDVKLNYNINMSRLALKNKSLLDLWKKFSNVSIGASLDGEYQRGEYLRQGLTWQDVLQNRKLMMDQCPHVDFYISATVSILNVLHLPDFHRSWVNQGLIKPEDFNIQMLFMPNYLRVDHGPKELKDKINQAYHDHLSWLMPRDPLGRATYGFHGVLSYIENDHEFDAKDFWSNIDLLDQYHGTNIFDVFPELDFLSR